MVAFFAQNYATLASTTYGYKSNINIMFDSEDKIDAIVNLLKIKAERAKTSNNEHILFTVEDVELLKTTAEILYIQLEKLQTKGYIQNLRPMDDNDEILENETDLTKFANILFVAKADLSVIKKHKSVEQIKKSDNMQGSVLAEYKMDYNTSTGKLYLNSLGSFTFSGKLNSKVLDFFYQHKADQRWFNYKDLEFIKANQLEKVVKGVNEQIDKKTKGNYIGIIKIKPREDVNNRRVPNEYCWGLY